jgi:hypothetical protein
MWITNTISSLCELVMIGDDRFNELLKDTAFVVVYMHKPKILNKIEWGSLYVYAED